MPIQEHPDPCFEGAPRPPAKIASRRWATGRTEAFSDAVFAIAITLLVLDLVVPESAFDNLWHGIAHEWPGYFGYLTSFLTIGAIWLAHQGIFNRLQYTNNTVMRINLLLLMAVAFLPFPTRLVAEAIRTSHAERAAVVFYGISLLVTNALLSGLWAAIVHDRQLLKPEISDQEIHAVTRRLAPSTASFLGVIVLAIIVPKVAAFGYLLIAIVAVLLAQGDSGTGTLPAHDAS